MLDYSPDDPLSAAVAGGLPTASQTGALNIAPIGTPLMNLRGRTNLATGQTEYRDTGGSLVDQAIQGRQAYENQRQSLIAQLPYVGRRQAVGIAASLNAMNQDEQNRHFEATQRRIMAHQSAMEADRQLKTDRDTEIDEQGSNLMGTMQYLDGALRNGQITKDDYNQGLLEAGQRFPMALRHPEAARHYEYAITEADKHDQFVARQREREAGRIASRYGVDVQVDPETGTPSVAATRQAALQSGKGRVEVLGQLNREMFDKYGLGTGVGSLFNPIQPHSSPDGGKTIDIPFIDKKTGKTATTNVPMSLFNQMKADFQDRYFATVPQQAAPQTPTADPRIALAQKAIDDPNASDAHKEAAKRILGLQ